MSAASSALKTATAAGGDAAAAAATTVKDAAGTVADEAKNLADEASDTVSGLSGKVSRRRERNRGVLEGQGERRGWFRTAATDDAALRGQGLLDQERTRPGTSTKRRPSWLPTRGRR